MIEHIINKNRYDEYGRRNGYWEYYYYDGNVFSKGYYINDNPQGYWEDYNFDGEKIMEEYYL